MQITANFSDLGLDDPAKKEDFKNDFAASMEAKFKGNKVTVTDVRAGSVIVDFEVEANTSDSAGLEALQNKSKDISNEIESGGFELRVANNTLQAPKQTVKVIEVDVTPPVNETFPFNITVRSQGQRN